MLYIRVGDAYRIDNRLDEAKVFYEKVLKVDPKNRYALFGLKKIAEEKNKIK